MSLASWEPQARSILRIVVGFTFSLHGFQKLLGMFGGMGAGAKAAFPSMPFFAGCIELVGGLLLLIGLLTRPAAFIACGEMAFAFFTVHFPRGPWPIKNGGELAVAYCFVFLYLFFAGAGPWSVDAAMRKTSP